MRYLNVHFPDTHAVMIAYSGGKDSLVCMDLAVKAGLQVEGFFMYYVPRMDYTAYWVDFAWKRWGVKVREYLHWDTIEVLRQGIMRPTQLAVKRVRMHDVEDRVRRESGIDWIGYGLRSQDSLERRGMLASWPNGICLDPARGKVFCPLKDWTTPMVKAYISRTGLPLPKAGLQDGAVGHGIDLGPESMAYLRQVWPGDYQRILKVFPFAAAQADRYPEMLKHKQDRLAQKKQAAQARRTAKKALTAAKQTPEQVQAP